MLTKVCANTVRTGTKVIREMTNGKKLFFQRVSWKSRVVSVEGRGAGMYEG